ncbi:cupin domain-containing protein [Mycolicibacterium chlorophenolicum]|uniref:cupin domain-containing protein n=1 Tax=Mycolicibacterium chlorophenolicum TaxID=37916 RepID=UPI00191C10DB|nr:cupin domain-containing protein [Mycolicibacterium chlorophenolicum]
MHSDFGVSRLDPGGAIPAHVHSFEETFYLMDGEVMLVTPEATVRLRPGDYGVIPVGVPHSWHAAASTTAVWADHFTPPPRTKYGHDTYPVTELPRAQPIAIDPRDPRTRSYGSITAVQLDPSKQSQELLARSASMRTALLVYSGISLKMMVDADLGAVASTMFMVQYEPDGRAGPHDHPFEECYLIVEGEVDATFDGQSFRLGPGDFAWAGVGCVHSFTATGAPVRWLETQAPQMPARHAYRFARDWDYLSQKLTPSG